jgi:hypothetical protein
VGWAGLGWTGQGVHFLKSALGPGSGPKIISARLVVGVRFLQVCVNRNGERIRGLAKGSRRLFAEFSIRRKLREIMHAMRALTNHNSH